MTLRSALYIGNVFHQRFRPRRHRLRYRVFWFLLDLDEIAALSKRLRLFSYNRFNLFSFRDTDHGTGANEPVRAQTDRALADAHIDLASGRIMLLCMPTILGYGFNPLSVYFCYSADGALAAILYQVHNTFGERHSYLIPVSAPADDPIHQSCGKCFYVSPFLDMAMTYDFTVSPPGEAVSVTVRAGDAQGAMLTASMTGKQAELTDRALLRVLLTHPLLTLKVIAGIHWEALQIWLKGTGFRSRPPAPASAVTIVHPSGA